MRNARLAPIETHSLADGFRECPTKSSVEPRKRFQHRVIAGPYNCAMKAIGGHVAVVYGMCPKNAAPHSNFSSAVLAAEPAICSESESMVARSGAVAFAVDFQYRDSPSRLTVPAFRCAGDARRRNSRSDRLPSLTATGQLSATCTCFLPSGEIMRRIVGHIVTHGHRSGPAQA